MRCLGLGLTTLLMLGLSFPGRAQVPSYSWAILIPENDSRPKEVRDFDEVVTKQLVHDMNNTETVFRHHLTWRQVPVSRLLSASVPFCEFDFDPVHPLVLTDREKAVLKEYFERGGVILLREGVYSYSPDELSGIKRWPIIDFLTGELPASSPDFRVEKIDEKHPLFHQYYSTRLPLPEARALQDFPHLPDLTLVSYKGHPCAFVYASYFCDGEKWLTISPPFPTDFSIVPEDYALWVNLYIYASMH